MRKLLRVLSVLMASLLLSSCAYLLPDKNYTYTLKADRTKKTQVSEEAKAEISKEKVAVKEKDRVVYRKKYEREREVKKTRKGGEIELHFENTPLSDVLKEVFGKVLGVSYVIPQSIDNPITLHIKGITKEEAVDVIKDILISMGYATVAENGTIKVLPTQAKPLGRNMSVLAFSPQYVDSSTLGRVVGNFVSPVGKVVVSKGGILVIDDESRLKVLKDFIREIDTPFYKGKEVAFIRTQLPPKKIKNNVEKILALLGKSDRGSVIESLDELGMVVVVAKDKRLFNDIMDWIELMESQEGQENKRLYIIRLNHAEAKEVAGLLNRLNVLEEISSVGEGKKVSKASVKAKQQEQSLTQGAKKKIQVQTLEEILIKSRTKTGSKKAKVVSKGSIVADENTNSLIVKATPLQYKVIKRVVKEIDRVPKQALIEMVVAEVSLGDSLKYGIEGLFKGLVSDMPFSVETSFGLRGGAAALSGFKGIIFNPKGDIRGILNFLAAKTELRVLSAPHILTKNNEEAVIEVGSEVPVLSEQLISTSGGVPSVSNSIQYRPTGIILKVKPIISESGTITLKITEEVSDAIPNNISPDIKSPIITKRSATTTLLLKDGQIALLGGIIQNRFEDSRRGVPGVSDVPLVGELFSTRDKSSSTTELVVLIKASVIETPEENEEAVSTFRRKVKALKDVLKISE